MKPSHLVRSAARLFPATMLLSRADVVAAKCQVQWGVNCGPKLARSNVTFSLTDDATGANVDPQYDADVVFHWGPATTDLGTRTFTTGEAISFLKSYQYETDGEYYTGYSVTFGEGSGMGCEGKTFQGYSLVAFDDDARTCSFGPTTASLPQAAIPPPPPPPSERPTYRPATPSPTRRPTVRPSMRPSAPPSKNPTRRPTVPETGMPLIAQEPPAPTERCGDDVCSTSEYDLVCQTDCTRITLAADPAGDAYADARGAMFSVASSRDIVITSMDVFSADVGLDRVEVWTRPGGFESRESNQGEWEIVYNNWNSLNGSPGQSATLNLNNMRGVIVPQGGTASFYVFTDSMVRCRAGTGVGDALTGDGVLEVFQGIGLDEKWAAGGGEGRPLAFRGAFKYDVVKSTPTASPTVTMAPTAAPTQPPVTVAPTAAPTVYVTQSLDVGSARTESPTPINIRPTTPSPIRQPVKNSVPLSTAEPGAKNSMTTAPSPSPITVATSILTPPTDEMPTTPGSQTDNPTATTPNMPRLEYKVSSEMVLYDMDLLDDESLRIWIDVTEETIHNEVVAETGIDSELVEVKVELEDQAILEQVRMLLTYRESLRNLQRRSSSPPRLQILFTITIQVPPEDDDVDADQIIESAFLSPAQRNNYVNALRSAGEGSYFETLEVMSIEVDEDSKTNAKAPSQGGSSEMNSSPMVVAGGDGGENSMYYIIGASVGGFCMLLMGTAIAVFVIRRAKGAESKKAQSSTTGTQDHLPLELDKVGLEIDTKSHRSATVHQPTNYIGAIESKEEVDDVSTLGDPYMGDAVNAVMDADNTVGESMVSSQQDMYVYGLRKSQGMDAKSLMGGSTINSGSYVRNNMIFGEDATLEDAYRSPHGTSMGEEDQGSSFQRLMVVAPGGKLGIVLDNPHGDLPIVWAIKETSPLNGKVRVGDLLLSVDGVDCRGMSTNRVSTFLSGRSQNPTRTLVLARGSN